MGRLTGYRTLAVNLAAIMVGLGLATQGDAAGLVAGAMAVVNIALRMITTTPMGQAEPTDANAAATELEALRDWLAHAHPEALHSWDSPPS
jgi:hypothetical protein